MLTLLIMSKDKCVGRYNEGKLDILNKTLLPLYPDRDVECWLEQRAIDPHRTNSRLLKKALRLENKDDINTFLYSNATTITDTYWVKPQNSSLTYEDVRFRSNHFDLLALRGDPDSFNQQPSRTPELTNTESFEKCWRFLDGKWWMYKSENASEQFTELFSYHLAKKLGIPMHSMKKTMDMSERWILQTGSVNFETAYGKTYRKLKEFGTIYVKPVVLT